MRSEGCARVSGPRMKVASGGGTSTVIPRMTDSVNPSNCVAVPGIRQPSTEADFPPRCKPRLRARGGLFFHRTQQRKPHAPLGIDTHGEHHAALLLILGKHDAGKAKHLQVVLVEFALDR